ncbi:MAG: hypothetical protein QM770_22975 [Tepidisphaeraceae bacterium]
MFDVLRERLAQLPDETTFRIKLGQSLARRTNESDTHPALADRLDRMGYLSQHGVSIETLRGDPRQVATRLPLPTFEPPTAAEQFFGDGFDTIIERASEDWAIDVAERWESRHHELLRDRGLIGLYDQKERDGTLTADEAFRRAIAEQSLEGDGRVPQLLEAALKLDEKHARANFMRGRLLLLNHHDEAGIPLIERAMASDPDAITPGCQVLWEHHTRCNQHELAEAVLKRYDAHEREVERAQQERAFLRDDGRWLKHELSRDELNRVLSVVRSIEQVNRAYLVKRVVTHFADKPCHALVILGRRIPWWKPYTAEFRGLLSNEITRRLPSDVELHTFVLPYNKHTAGLRARFSRAGQMHCVYDRKKR